MSETKTQFKLRKFTKGKWEHVGPTISDDGLKSLEYVTKMARTYKELYKRNKIELYREIVTTTTTTTEEVIKL